jgi:hypothetical protein
VDDVRNGTCAIRGSDGGDDRAVADRLDFDAVPIGQREYVHSRSVWHLSKILAGHSRLPAGGLPGLYCAQAFTDGADRDTHQHRHDPAGREHGHSWGAHDNADNAINARQHGTHVSATSKGG